MERIEYFLHKAISVNALGVIYVANFFMALHLFLVIYINSSYLSEIIPLKFVGLVYIVGSLGGVLSLFIISEILKRFGNVRTLVTLTILEFLVFIGLAFPGHPYVAILLFVSYMTIYPMILVILDIFLENSTKQESNTGSIRGTFLTTTNAALMMSPIIAGFILSDSMYWRVFLVSAVSLIPFLFIISKRFKNFKDPEYHTFEIKNTLSKIVRNKPVLNIFKAHFIMRLFFVWMVIYSPIYLHENIGLSWSAIGIIFTIMLLPFMLLELPAGKLADGWIGEKEMLSIGFVVTAVFVGIIPFITTANVFVWTAVLFATRVGAALLESMTETYFFKHVDDDDSNIISFFRMARPLSYILGLTISTIALLFIDIQFIFLVFSIIILFGLRYSLAIKDTV